jgi:2-dehydro-3-deoxyphosphooctonate aldolase (KDO 8-P synthase)
LFVEKDMREVKVGEVRIGEGQPLVVIAGPCVIESEEMTFRTAELLREMSVELSIPLIFKSSFDKANRSSLSSFRGPGIKKGLKVLGDVKKRFSVPVTSDVHAVDQVEPAAEVLDLLQIPAFLCRQTDLVLAASKTGKPVNVKKGQFLSPWEVKNITEKFVSTGNRNLLITERGSSFGYHNLVVDFRGFPVIRSLGTPLIFDVTHSLQLPGGEGSHSGGQREFAAPLMRAAVGAGVDGLFIEVHPEPDRALCDGPNMIALSEIKELLKQAKSIHELVRTWGVV